MRLNLIFLGTFILIYATCFGQREKSKDYVYPKVIFTSIPYSYNQCLGKIRPFLYFKGKELPFNHFGDIYTELLLDHEKIKLEPGKHKLILKNGDSLVDSTFINIPYDNKEITFYPEFKYLLKCCEQDRGLGLKYVRHTQEIINSECNSVNQFIERIKRTNDSLIFVAVYNDSISKSIAQSRLDYVKLEVEKKVDIRNIAFKVKYLENRYQILERFGLFYAEECDKKSNCEWGILLQKINTD
jgi:hypothetical protein